jgi:hypothetical protein
MFLDKIQHPTKEKYFHEFIKHLYSWLCNGPKEWQNMKLCI